MNKTPHISTTSTLHKTILKSVMIWLLWVLTQCAPSWSSDNNPWQQDSSMVMINETHPRLKWISTHELMRIAININQQPHIIYDSISRTPVWMIYANCVGNGKHTRDVNMPIIEYQDISRNNQWKIISLNISIAGVRLLYNDFDQDTLDYFLDNLTQLNSKKIQLKY